MDIVGVGGSTSKAGKTTLISLMLEDSRYKTAVIKTSIDNSLKQYKIITDRKIIHQKGTDTARFIESGADRVVLLKSPASQIPEAFNIVENLIGKVERLLIEGNTLNNFLNPDLIFYLDNSEEEEKESARIIKNRAHIVISSNILLQSRKLTELPIEIKADSLTCYQAHLLADLLKINVGRVGKIIHDQNIKLKKCQLGLF
ncbi:MAG: hypothetical protein ACQESS_09070 [Bacillota bacterium]